MMKKQGKPIEEEEDKEDEVAAVLLAFEGDDDAWKEA